MPSRAAVPIRRHARGPLAPELSTLSGDFRSKWGAHDVRRHAAGRKRFHHPVVGDLDLLFESTDVAADPGWKLLIYTAEPGSPTADAIQLLASWAATQEQHSAPIRPNHLRERASTWSSG